MREYLLAYCLIGLALGAVDMTCSAQSLRRVFSDGMTHAVLTMVLLVFIWPFVVWKVWKVLTRANTR